MRAWLTVTVILAGCLHAQTPPKRATETSAQSEFKRLIGDPKKVQEAVIFAAKRHLNRRDVIGPAAAAYAKFMQGGKYAAAAEIAWRLDFGHSAVVEPFARQHERVSQRVAAFRASRGENAYENILPDVERLFADETLIGCRYSSDPVDGQAVIDDIMAFRQASLDDRVLFPLLDYGCPVTIEQRDMIIEAAFEAVRDEFVIREVVKAGWPFEAKLGLTRRFFNFARCGSGFHAAAVLKIQPVEVVTMVEWSGCEQAAVSIEDGWVRPADANTYFFAAVRRSKFNLALALLPFCGCGEDGREYLFQEALRQGRGGELVKALAFHPGYHDALMQYAFDQGRYRFVGQYAQTYDWERKAFDKLVELGRYDFAAEVAEYGVSETLRSQGVTLAFQAAMAAGDFKAGRYFLARYGPTATKAGLITQEMYDEAEKKWQAAHPAAAPMPPAPKPVKAKPKRHQRSACPTDDWCVGDGK